MVFYNRKEEVLEIELTSYGRHMLSKGEFKPAFYSFFDDDIIYDSAYIGYSEDQNAAEDRIEETPRNKIQTSFRNSRELFTTNVLYWENPDPGPQEPQIIQTYFTRNYALTSELGIADYYSDNSPAFDVQVLRGEISNSSMIFTSSIEVGSTYEGPKYPIPQLNMEDLSYEKVIGQSRPDPLFDSDEREILPLEDGYLEIRDDFLLLEIDEKNTPFQKENFKIELFEVGEEFLPKLGDTHPSAVILLHNSALGLRPVKFWGPTADSGLPPGETSLRAVEYADYYLTIQVDEEVPDGDLCKYKGISSTKGIFLQDSVYNCELEESSKITMYQEEDFDIGEVCD